MNSSRKRQVIVRISNPNYIKPDHTPALAVFTPQGISGIQLLQFAGAIPRDDVMIMKEAIEQGCEQVDDSEW